MRRRKKSNSHVSRRKRPNRGNTPFDTTRRTTHRIPSEKLLEWFAKSQRPLPWRRGRNAYLPYPVLVAEVMLQQTRVQQMLPYYERFLQRFPTLKALARAREQAVLKAWEGLGYYGRARNLHKAAKKIVRERRGKIPRTLAELKRLPGLGAYTAAAVSSIAFNENVAVVDGNVARVLARFHGEKGDAANAKTRAMFQGLAATSLPRGRARDYNQAMMELGALVCLPRQPLCATCPLAGGCFARAHDMQDRYPESLKRDTRPTKTFAALAVLRPVPAPDKGGRHARLGGWRHHGIERRGSSGRGNGAGEALWLVKGGKRLLGGLWGFPLVAYAPERDGKRSLEKRFREAFDAAVSLERELGAVEHDYSHFHQRVVLFRGRVKKTRRGSERQTMTGQWVSRARRRRLPLSKVTQKLLALAEPA